MAEIELQGPAGVALTAGSATAGAQGQACGTGAIAGGAVALLAILFMLTAVLAGLGGVTPGASAPGATDAADEGVSALAQAEIPPQYLRYYQEAAQRYGLDWAILAGIGKVECDHGRDPDPSCTREGAVNAAGAGGPMQFIASTWALYGVDADGDGRIDRWDPADAIYSAANLLRAAGAPQNYSAAIFAYNHASWYVADVERWAARYRGPEASASSILRGEGEGEEGREEGEGAGADTSLEGESPTPVRFVAGERALLSAEDGHLALIPADVPATVQAMVVAGNELQDLPYGPGGHPDPRGAPEEDCSSTINYVLYRSGVRPIAEIVRDNPLAQDYVNWGAPGPGRWVTIYSTRSPTPHVFIVIAGLRLDTSHNGTDVGPNRNEDGPRWRILDHIPTWAHWSVRHPPGL
jgi:Transglycosylase SLT domain